MSRIKDQENVNIPVDKKLQSKKIEWWHDRQKGSKTGKYGVIK